VAGYGSPQTIENTPFMLARLAGLEPATPGLEGRCSIHLSYRRVKVIVQGCAACERYTPAFGSGADDSIDMFPRRDRRSAAQTRIATLIALAVILAGLWLLRQREAAAPAAPPASASVPSTVPREVPAPAPRGPDTGTVPVDTPAPKPRGHESATAPAERHDLQADERKGGHTLARHVARTVAQLRERLEREPRISAASSYTSQALAERTVARTLARNAARVTAWTTRSGNRPNLALDYRGPRDEIIGRSIRRGRDPVDCSDAVVVLRWDGSRGHYVLTSYPEAAR
jgi:Bacterial CdiA-CT RNAse A domain